MLSANLIDLIKIISNTSGEIKWQVTECETPIPIVNYEKLSYKMSPVLQG